MGKSVKITSLINHLIEYLELNRSEIQINHTGLKKGEKLKEEISISKNYKKTKYNKILTFSEVKYKDEDVNKLVQNLEYYFKKNKETMLNKLMKNFLSRETKK